MAAEESAAVAAVAEAETVRARAAATEHRCLVLMAGMTALSSSEGGVGVNEWGMPKQSVESEHNCFQSQLTEK
ncbi:hypothetical protein GCM10022295_14210 [Streptomyces osmaniensis]|uniref:Uncharacterized protein n=1 Tax=Streptomyces osmaniensis TaxID=593134 RepID=A0ABP6VER9_9ACTN